ncbi:alpha/beta fold hydrolase [Paracoccus tegillarcae]|uniref:Alpha/beta hydrolase n=1 Tax=Paracoccus tegillarcae TaxID=1529068 RepID=A0A2K9EFT5_9RHOB|nr:alpha/beta hydrolase [Paracoccus tegillarcae]AUH33803.1 alpha/beta hydrolase [Paracoccus tegillarcae]
MRKLLLFLLGLVLGALLLVGGLRIAAALREAQPLAAVLPAEGQLIETEAGSLFVQDLGPRDGPVLLFLHGTAAWSGLWRPTLEAMAGQGYRAIALDMPPFGFSQRDPAGRYDRAHQAQVVHALIRALQIRPVLVAHSFGAGPGVEAVMQTPGAFAGLVVVDGALAIGAQPSQLPLPLRSDWMRQAGIAVTATNPMMTRRLLASFLHVKSAATDEVVDILQRPMTRQGSTAAFADWLPSLLTVPSDALSIRPDSYRDLCLPTVFLWGQEDTVTPLEQGRQAAGLVPGAALLVMPNTGHIPQIETPAPFLDALQQGLRRIKAADPPC